jgi:hypothetical protein
VYLVPKNVKARFELLPGFGLPEIALCAGGLAVGFVLSLLVSLLGASALIRMVLVVVPAGFMFFVTRAGSEGESLFGLVLSYRRWKTGQRRFFNVPKGGGVQ